MASEVELKALANQEKYQRAVEVFGDSIVIFQKIMKIVAYINVSTMLLAV